MDFLAVFSKMIQLFLIIVIGYIACKCGVFGKEARKHVTKLVLNVAIPGITLSSVLNQQNLPGAVEIAGIFGVAIASYVVLMGVGILISKLLRASKADEIIYSFMFAFANVGFMGYPVTQAIFGEEALFYTCIFNLPFNFLVFSIGIMMIQKSAAASEQGGEKREPFVITYKTFLTPCLIASVLAILLALTGIKAPAVIGDTCKMLGDMTTPAALMIIGSTLAEIPVKEMFKNGKVYIFTIFKLLLIPLLLYGIFGLFITDNLLLGVCVVLAAMPVATNGTMLCLQYQADDKLMAQGTFVTTLFSLITTPVLAMLFR